MSHAELTKKKQQINNILEDQTQTVKPHTTKTVNELSFV